jgi:hypothetical protein
MATTRSMIVDESVTPWYHCTSRCVRRAFLCGPGFEHRKTWVEQRLKTLVEIFAIDGAGFAVMDNHLHVLLRIDSARTRDWSDEDVARRWLRLFSIRDVDGNALPVAATRLRQLAEDVEAVGKLRGRLASLSWFMKCLKEPLARLANKEDGCSGAFFEGRFRSVAVLDEASLLATAAYIDLNPVAAGVAPTPEASAHTSFRARLDHCREQGTTETVRDDLSTLTHDAAQEQDRWLLPINDLCGEGTTRAGLMPGLTLSCDVRLIDWTSRQLREGKAAVPADAAPIFQRLGTDPHEWGTTVAKLVSRPKPTGSHFGCRAQLSAATAAHGRRWHRNRLPRTPGFSTRAA